MALFTKKTIIREVLIFLSVIIIIGLVWPILYYNQQSRIQQVKQLTTQIDLKQSKIDSLNKWEPPSIDTPLPDINQLNANLPLPKGTKLKNPSHIKYPNKGLRHLYNYLDTSGYVIGLPSSFNDFEIVMHNPTKAQQFYNAIKTNPNIKGIPNSYDTFASQLGLLKLVTDSELLSELNRNTITHNNKQLPSPQEILGNDANKRVNVNSLIDPKPEVDLPVFVKDSAKENRIKRLTNERATKISQRAIIENSTFYNIDLTYSVSYLFLTLLIIAYPVRGAIQYRYKIKSLIVNKKFLIGIGIVLFLLIITNPSPTAFKSYLGEKNYYGLRRQYNFFVFSIYKESGKEYFAIAGNFIEMKKD